MKPPDPNCGKANEGMARQPIATQVAEIIKQRIKQGIYQPGTQLPSLRTLSGELNLALPAVQRAVRQLELEMILESRHGVGIRILEGADCGGTPLLYGFVQPYFSRFSLALQHYIEQGLDSRSNLCVMKSSHNDPAREQREIERLINSRVSGLLLWPVDDDTNGAYLQAVARRLPVVFVDRTLEGVSAPSVVLDYTACARDMVRHLHKLKKRRLLVVCEPAAISSYQQLKAGLREEAAALGEGFSLTIRDFPVVRLIENAYQQDYAVADECYTALKPLLESGEYDALFCPQSEFYDHVFADSGRAEILRDLHCVTLRTPDGPPHSRRYAELELEEWILDTAGMLVRALDLLQDMTVTRRNWKRTVRIPVWRREAETRSG